MEKSPEGSVYDSMPSCNQKFYGTKRYLKELPSYICVPEGNAISDFVRTTDVDGDGVADFLFVQYRKWRDSWIDGDTLYWDFHVRDSNGRFQKKFSLSNIEPPYINDTSLEYLADNDLAQRIFESYPIPLTDNSLGFNVTGDTIRLSYKFDDAKGKSFIFIYSTEKDNWYLEKIEYFFGELPIWWWRDDDFYSSLRDNLLVLKSTLPFEHVAIGEFSLIEAFKHRSKEARYLSECYTRKIDARLKSLFKKIDKVEFQKLCNDTLLLPSDWKY